MERELHILMLEDNPADAELISYQLRKSGFSFTSKRVETEEEFTRELTDSRPDLILLDYELPSFDGSSALAIARTVAPGIPVIFVTGVLGEELAIDKLHEGATDYVLKSRLSRLVPAVTRALTEVEEKAKRQAAEEALRESEEKYRTLYESSLDGIVMVDMARRVTDANQAFLDMLGYTLKEVMGVDYERFTSPKWHEMEQNIIDSQTKVRGYSDEYKKEYIRKDGTVFPIELRNWLIADDEGNPTGMWAIVRDITERKQAEEALSASEEILQTIFDSTPAFVYFKDKDNTLLRVNKSVCDAMGVREEEVKGKKLPEVFANWQEAYWEDDLEVIESGKPKLGIIETGRTPEGTKYFQTDKIPYRNAEGEIVGIIGFSVDITDRKKAEEAQRDRERQLSSVFENVHEVLFYLSVEPDNRYRFLSVNQAFLEATGLLEDQVVGKYVHEVSPEPSLTLVLENYERAVRDNQKVRWEEVTDYPAGRKYGDVAVTPIFDSSGCCTNLLGSVHDVTERKAAEEALKLANRELEGYAHTVSHDLRGPLSAAGAAIDLIKDMRERPLTDDVLARVDEGLDIVASGVDRAITMTEDLLTLAQAGTAPGELEPVDISGVLRSLLEERKMLLKERGVQVNVDDDLGVTAMDPTHAYQVFSSLIGNAIKHNDSENPEIHISRLGETGPGMLRYMVRDNGPGIPEGAEEDIFLPFHKGPNSTDAGIGLSIVDKVVRLYGGQIRAYNDNNGACFEFTLKDFTYQAS
jgi:PAS domain S-box-containing protein